MSKKIIALLLALVMVLSLVACGNNEAGNENAGNTGNENADNTGNENVGGEEEPGLYDEHVTLTYCFPDAMGAANYANWDDIVAAVNAITEEKINATINFEIIPLGEYTDKMGNKYLTGEEFDVCFTGAWNPYATAVGQGGYAELTQEMLQTYAADTLAVLNEDCWGAVTIGGKIYGVPLQQIWVRQNSVRFNTDKADSYGFDYTTVTDLADVEPYLEQLKQAGEEYIFYADGATIVNNLSMYMGFDMLIDYKTPGAVYYTGDTTIVNQYATEEFLEAAKLMKKWNDAGYIHSEATIEGVLDPHTFAVDLNPALKPGGDVTEAGTRGYNVVSMPVGSTALTTSGIVATNLAVGATSKNPERALAFINLLNTDAELLNLICHGIEGTDWNYTDEANKVIAKVEGGYPGNYSFLVGNVFNEYYTDASQVGSWEETAQMNGNAPGSCILGFSFDATPVAGEIAAMQAVVDEHLPAISAGEVEDVEAAVKAMNDALEAAGLSTVLAEMQAQVDAWAG